MELGMPTLIELPDLTDCVELCRELGLQFVELNMNLPQYQIGQTAVDRFRSLRERYGVYFTLHLDENLNVCDYNPYVSQAYTRTVMEAVQAAKQLEIPVLNMHLSRGVYFTLPEKKVFLFDIYRERYLADMRAFRDRCTAAASASDIRICVENSSGFTGFQVEALDLLLESPVFALTFDIGHSCSAGGGDEAVILQRQNKLIHFHIHDARGTQNHLPLGDGDIHIPGYLALADRCGGRAVLETKTAEGLRKSVRWLRETGFCK